MKELTNTEKGALKRKLRLKKDTVFQPGELISRINASKGSLSAKTKLAIKGLV